MKKSIILCIIALGLMILTSCEKSQHQVSYFVTSSQSGFTISYLDEEGVIQTTSVTTQSASEKVTVYSFFADEGDIVYMSVTDTTVTSFVRARIYVDGKVYKEATRNDNNTMPVTVSGTIPY